MGEQSRLDTGTRLLAPLKCGEYICLQTRRMNTQASGVALAPWSVTVFRRWHDAFVSLHRTFPVLSGEILMGSRSRTWLLLCVMSFGLILAGGIAHPAVAADDLPAIETTECFVPMSDGIELATTVYRPNEPGPFPVIVARTPYNKDGLSNEAKRFCRSGYAFIAQDLRGRFKSKGHHAVIFHNDGWNTPHDGHDTLAWIAQQPWCNGKIGSTGGSALGITQNMAAPGAPPALAAQHVVVAFSDMYRQGAYQGGAFRTGLLENWLKATGMVDVNLATFVAHPRFDEFWEELNAESQAERVNAPGVFFGGWYDIFLQGTINSFLTIQSRGGSAAKGRCRLVIAPIGHGSMTELKYPASASRLPRCADNLAWFDAMLKGQDNGIAAEKPVHYYVMGDPTDEHAPGNTWRTADTWPPPSAATAYYLDTTGTLSTTRPAESGSRSYKYDPAQPVPTIGGAELGANIGPRDQRSLETRPDVLVFTSDVLESPLEVTGRIGARLFVSSDCPDTDFTVKLTDVYADGRSMLVTDGIMRARFRESFEKEQPLEPGKITEIPVDLWSTSLVFNKGHRIRIAISSSNSPRFDPNPNTGHAFRADQEQRVANNTLYFSEKYPTQIVLPVYQEP
jgi:predicted acyl esterase